MKEEDLHTIDRLNLVLLLCIVNVKFASVLCSFKIEGN